MLARAETAPRQRRQALTAARIPRSTGLSIESSQKRKRKETTTYSNGFSTKYNITTHYAFLQSWTIRHPRKSCRACFPQADVWFRLWSVQSPVNPVLDAILGPFRCPKSAPDPTAGSFNQGSGTPYSMNRLFSEFFRKFGGAFLEVCETISGGSGEVFRGKIKKQYIEQLFFWP